MQKLNKEGGFNHESEFCDEKVYVQIFPSRFNAYQILTRIEQEVDALRECTHDADLVLSYFFRMLNPVSGWDKSRAERILYTILGAIQTHRENPPE